jgi:TetR/AcrR family transcriptional regulator, regulator of cefoperazone and chloramphenicol sensitivity
LSDGEKEKKGSRDKRQRLLEAAGEVFALRGFKAATIQEISQRADANIAAVNYHFRDKESLYREVFRYAMDQSRQRYLSYPMDESERRPSRRLQLELRRYLYVMFSRDQAPWQAMMFYREMLEPTEVFESLVTEQMVPHHKHVESLLRNVIGPDADQQLVRFSTMAAIFLCSSFRSAQNFIRKVYPEEHFDAATDDELADLITMFVIGGLRALKPRTNPNRRVCSMPKQPNAG